jgi:phosphoenolpyruvate carboxykinase (ATP)
MIGNIWNIKTPAHDIAQARASDFKLSNHGLNNLGVVYWNLTSAALYGEALFRREGTLAHMGPLVVNTGKHTARAAKTSLSSAKQPLNNIWWGQYNRPFSATNRFSAVHERLQAYIQDTIYLCKTVMLAPTRTTKCRFA